MDLGRGEPPLQIAILMGKTDPTAPATYSSSRWCSCPWTPRASTIVRALPVFGYQDREGHCELRFDDVRVPVTNLLGEEGGGFAIAQARLGPGRIHHCMRCIGMAERALELMCRRVTQPGRLRQDAGRAGRDPGVDRRQPHRDRPGPPPHHEGGVADGHRRQQGRPHEISAIKVVAPNMALRVVDRAIQAHGGGGVSDDFPLAAMYAGLRTLRLADGPDEVHRMQLARRELRKYEDVAPPGPTGPVPAVDAADRPTSADLGVAR